MVFALVALLVGREAPGAVAEGSVLPPYGLREPDTVFLRQLRKDPAFCYDRPVGKEGWQEMLLHWLKKRLGKADVSWKAPWLVPVLRVVAVLLLIFLIYKLVRMRYVTPFGRRVREFEADADDPAATHDEVSFHRKLEEAVGAGDYVLAVRVHYLYLLHLLDERGIIHWNRGMTNRACVCEIGDGELRRRFERLSYVFNCVCYGGFPVDAAMYSRFGEEFRRFEEEVGR